MGNLAREAPTDGGRDVNRNFASSAHRATQVGLTTRALTIVGFLGLFLAMAAILPRAASAAPTHPFLEAASLDGADTPSGEFENACGVAVDSKGDVYVANSANGAIDVFGPGGEYLTSIADPNAPCGLAVDTKGNVYVVDTAAGNVVMFAPTGGTYPPTAGLTYEAAQTIDSSTDAKAVAVNPANDHVFVNQGTQIVEYDSDANGSGVLKSEIGSGTLTQGFGVDVYDATGNVYAADETGTVYVFNPAGAEVLAEIDGTGSPVGTFGALPQANIAVNQSNGHVLISDVEEAGAVYEFESTGPYLSTIEHEGMEAAEPTDLAVDPTEATATSNRVYVTSGSGTGSEVLAFGPLPVPSHARAPEWDPDPTETPAGGFTSACGVAVDSTGNVYVTSTGTSSIDIFKPEGGELKYLASITDENKPCGAAVDSEGNLYVAHPTSLENNVVLYEPTVAYPFVGAPTYSAPKEVDPGGEFADEGLAVNPSDDHLFVTHRQEVWEYKSAAEGSGLVSNSINGTANGAGVNSASGLGVCGSSGNVFVVNNKVGSRGVNVIDPDTNRLLRIIDGANAVSKKPDGGFGSLGSSQLGVDQFDCHVYVSRLGGDIYEFEESGAYVSRFNRTSATGPLPGIAVDNSAGPTSRFIFAVPGIGVEPAVAQAYEGPALYGAPPNAQLTGLSGANGTEATFEGSVDPGGVEVTACDFEYVDEATFEATGFAAAAKAPCVPGPAGIGEGEDPVAVQAHVTGLDPSLQYRFRLVAANEFGGDTTNARRFGPPAVTPEPPSEVLYTEATLAGEVDPAGSETEYLFEYGPTEAYGSKTAVGKLGGEVPQSVSANVFGLEEGQTYHFRLVATNAIGSGMGPDQTFTTLVETDPEPEPCANKEFRTGPSASLPDCRAYELVSPPDVGGRTLGDLRAGLTNFSASMSTPEGEGLIFYTEGALPGTEGNGVKDGYESTRGPSGWITNLVGPSGAQAVSPQAGGVSAEHEYAFWISGGQGGTLDPGGSSANYLRGPTGDFGLIGLGETADDPDALGRWITPDGSGLIFTSDVPLTLDAPPAGTDAIYERTPDGTATLLSLLPGNSTPGGGQDAIYLGASADGSSVAFRIGSTLYLRRGGVTTSVLTGEFAFGGFSADGTCLFYVELPAPTPPTTVQRGEALRYDADAAITTPIGSGGESVLVNVSADGSNVYFSSRQQLDGSNGILGEENLYVWDGASIAFIGALDSEDIESTGDQAAQRLGIWTRALAPPDQVGRGLGIDPSRTTPDGDTFVFESVASLTAYDNEGEREVYRYDAEADQLDCLSCPFGQDPGDGATLQTLSVEARDSPADTFTVIPNVDADGAAVFFQTAEKLVPQDQNEAQDVYEWREGQVFLISPGTGEDPSYLYAMSSDGRDVFIATSVTLLPADTDGGARSIYDAREGGGFPAPPVKLPCQADECKGPLSPPPALPVPASPTLNDSGNVNEPPAKRKKCRKGKRAVKRAGKVRCVAKKKGKARRGTARGKGGRR